MPRYKTKTGGKTAKKGDGVNPSIYSKSGGNLNQRRPKQKTRSAPKRKRGGRASAEKGLWFT